jgi:EAL domain-containing protein (putative c-di-GMP-specific phosphodiesterase class I)
LHYQPIYRMRDIRMAGAEALARWHHDGRMHPAGQWIPAAESTGQLVPVAHQLLTCLVRDLPLWIRDRGEDFFVTFNLSSRELSDTGFVDRLIERLAPFRNQVLLEITESLELYDSAEAEEGLERVRAGGLRLAIDDFGTGYSNLTQLARLRPSLLKTDRTLVERAGGREPQAAAFLQTAADLALSLECDVVVEGIETDAEAEAARLTGATYVQGYKYARPAPLDQWLSRSVTQAR